MLLRSHAHLPSRTYIRISFRLFSNHWTAPSFFATAHFLCRTQVSVDATFKILFKDHAIMTFGFVTKNALHKNLATTVFRPIAFALCDKETTFAQVTLFRAVIHIMGIIGVPDFSARVATVHRDWHSAYPKSVTACFPTSMGGGDFFHLMKNLRKGLRKVLNLRVYVPRPVGGFLKIYFGPFLAYVKISRCLPTCAYFHVFWKTVFYRLESKGERRACKHFQKEYMRRCPKRIAFELYPSLAAWPGVSLGCAEPWVWVAEWWAGWEQCQPGFASGTQPLENWHRHDLKACVHAHLASPRVVLCEGFGLCAYVHQLAIGADASSDLLPDRPPAVVPDLYRGGAAFAKKGRSNAKALQAAASKGFLETASWEDGSMLFCLPRTLLQWSPNGKDAFFFQKHLPTRLRRHA